MLAEQKNYKVRCETLAFKNQFIPRLTADAKELREKLAEQEKSETASKTKPKRQKKRSIAADIGVAAFETEPASVKAAYTSLVGVLQQAEENALGARTELRVLQVRYSDVVREVKLAYEHLDEVW